MNRRFVLKAGLVLAGTSHTAVATADQPAEIRRLDPLLETIREYQDGLSDWIRNSPDDNDGAMAFSDVTYGPPLARLQQWNQPATTKEGAIAALKLAIDDDNGVRGMEAEDRLMKAVLGYLEGIA